jgi:hypothetical protein
MKKQKPIPVWAIKAAKELDNYYWLRRDNKEGNIPDYDPLSSKNIEKVARIIADTHEKETK